MANRHLSRSVALQTLFEWDFNGQVDARVPEILERNLKEFAPGMESDNFAEQLINGVLQKKSQINAIIEKAAPEWPMEQIAVVDRNALRIGLYELLFGNRDEVPPKVAINEAIELAKTFGGDSSGKFVNGVLGTVYREIGEPGKDEVSKKKTASDITQLPQEALAGAVVCRKEGNDILYALVHDVFGFWTLSKGRLKEGEDAHDGALREVREELGIVDMQITVELGQNEYVASDPERGQIRKSVTYFLAFTPETALKLSSGGGLDDAKWFKYGELEGLKIYDDIRGLLAKAQAILSEEPSDPLNSHEH
ncbi:MAG: transcription antitermination factor NusB [Candidatus Niyogibacteria bacterium]|nr:transcription antitermination factor NusB [Candidatus Niyogibacteria bacterium]